jgi:hypothetical protein
VLVIHFKTWKFWNSNQHWNSASADEINSNFDRTEYFNLLVFWKFWNSNCFVISNVFFQILTLQNISNKSRLIWTRVSNLFDYASNYRNFRHYFEQMKNEVSCFIPCQGFSFCKIETLKLSKFETFKVWNFETKLWNFKLWNLKLFFFMFDLEI